MANGLVDNQPVAYRCPNEREPQGMKCPGTLVYAAGELVAQCSTCGGWTGIAAPGLVMLDVQTGAATGARDKWTVSIGRSRHSFQNDLVLECGVPECHFKRHLAATRLHASGLNLMMDEHPCPQPAPESAHEPLPEAAS